jgi:hypothetical protein
MTIAVGSQSVIDLVMAADVTALQEVVVTGYTTQSRRDITGAITSVDTEKLNEMPAASLAPIARQGGGSYRRTGQPSG